MSERKTIEIAKIKERANAMLRNSRDEMTREREGIIALLEGILFEANAYHGYGFIGEYHEGMDETRRQYR